MLKLIVSLLITTVLVSSCDNSSQTSYAKNKTLLQGKTMGTSYHIAIIHTKDKEIDKSLIQVDIEQLLSKINQQVSTYIPDSQISLFNQIKHTQWKKVDKDFFSIVEAAQQVSRESDGTFDISLSPLIVAWGFGNKDKESIPKEAEIKNLLNNIGYHKLQLDKETTSLRKKEVSLQIDLSAIAKGFAVDKISIYLTKQGLPNHLVEIGGELRVSGTNQADKLWRIAVEQPDPNSTISNKGIELSDQAVATSGDYRNYFVENGIRRSHILNPKTGYPITHQLASVTVLHDSTMLADAYATAILVMGENLGKEFAEKHNLEILMIIREGEKFKFWSSSTVFQ